MRKVRIAYGNGERRVIGRVEGNVFITDRSEKKHMFRGGHKTLQEAKEDGTLAWGIDCIACDGLIEQGVETIRINTKRKVYTTKLAMFRNRGFVLHMKPHRAQYFLSVEEFDVSDV